MKASFKWICECGIKVDPSEEYVCRVTNHFDPVEVMEATQKLTNRIMSDIKYNQNHSTYMNINRANSFIEVHEKENRLWCDGGNECRCICHQKDYDLPKDFIKSINPVTGQIADIRDIKKMQINCYRCGKTATIKISNTMEMTHEMMATIERNLKDWQRYHCKNKPIR